MQTRKRSLIKSGMGLSVLTLLSRVLGLVREATKSAFLGTGPLADAFTVAFMIPNLLRRIFAENTMTVAFIPTFREYCERGTSAGNEPAHTSGLSGGAPYGGEMKEFLSASFTMIAFTAAAATALGMIGAAVIIALFFPEIADYASTVFLTRLMFPYLLLISIAAFFQGILNGVRIFLPTGITPIFFNLSVIGGTYLLAKPLHNPAYAMAVGVIAGGTLQMLMQLPFVLKAGFRFSIVSLRRTFANAGTRKILALLVPTLIGTAAYQINDLVSTALASYVGVGVAASLQYSIRLQELILGVFVVSVSTVILPDLTSYAVRKDWDAFQTLLAAAAKLIAFITITATLFLLCSGEQLIILVYKSNRFDDESVRLTWQAFRWHSAGLFFIALNRIITAAFYAQSNTKTPTVAGITSFAVNILAAGIAAPFMKGGGIAFALSFASLVNTLLLFWFLRAVHIDVPLFLRDMLTFMGKVLGCALIAGVPLYFFADYLYAPFVHYHRFIAKGVPFIVSAALYGLAVTVGMLIAGDTFLMQCLHKLKKRLR